jgi:hypothetical protein
MRAIQKVTSSELLKRASRTKFYYTYTKKTFILKLVLKVVTAGNEAHVAFGNRFLYARDISEYSHVLTPSHIVMEEHYTVCQHSTPLVLNGAMQLLLVFCNTFLPLWYLVQ